MLRLIDVDLCIRKVRQTTCVIEMQVGHHNVPHILPGEPQPRKLPNRCLLHVAAASECEGERTNQSRWICAVLNTETRVHQYKAIIGFDEQAVDDTANPWVVGGH